MSTTLMHTPGAGVQDSIRSCSHIQYDYYILVGLPLMHTWCDNLRYTRICFITWLFAFMAHHIYKIYYTEFTRKFCHKYNNPAQWISLYGQCMWNTKRTFDYIGYLNTSTECSKIIIRKIIWRARMNLYDFS